MKSHVYHATLTDAGRLLGGMLVPVILFALLLRLGSAGGILPAPWPAWDVDHTILTHQIEASRSPSDADVLFIGDSSCLMDFSGKGLETMLAGRHRIINLGSLSYLGLNGYAAMLSRYATVNPGRLRTVVVLLHPEMLRGITPVAQYLLFVSDSYAGADQSQAETGEDQLRGLLGLGIFQGRFLSRVPLPLPGPYGFYYGFTRDLYHFMDQEKGSAIDPHQFVRHPGQGNAEYRLAPSWQSGCQAFKAAVPSGVKLVVGITPVPQSFAPPDYAPHWSRILAQWGQWMQADMLLTELPPTLPDAWFASTTHLNGTGASHYTTILARCLKTRSEP